MKASGYFSHRQVFSNKFQSSKKKTFGGKKFTGQLWLASSAISQ